MPCTKLTVSPIMLSLILMASFSPVYADDAQTTGEFEALEVALSQETERWYSTFETKDGEIDDIARYDEWPLWRFIPKFVSLARTDANLTLRVAGWVSEASDRVGIGDRRVYDTDEQIIQLVRDRSLYDASVTKLLVSYQDRPSEPREELLRVCLHDIARRELRGVACLALGLHLQAKARFGRVAATSDDTLVDDDAFAEHTRLLQSEKYRSYLEMIDPVHANTESKQLIERAKKEFGDVTYPDQRFTIDNVSPTIADYVNSLRTGVAPV